MIRYLILNIVTGSILVLIIFLIMLNDFWPFWFFTLYIPFFLFILYQYLLTKFNWLITIANFVVCLIVVETLMRYITKGNIYPSEYFDYQHFPTSFYLRSQCVYWVGIKILIDLALVKTVNKKNLKPSLLERIFIRE